MKTVAQLARTIDPAFVRAYGAIRRFVVSLTEGAIWQIVGVRMPDGQEARNAEVFGGIGVAARPPADVEAEAIVAMGGDANMPIVVAVRDEATRAAVAGDLQPDETALYNSKALARVNADGTIDLRAPNGIAEKMLKGETYRSAEDTLLTALGTFATAIGALDPLTASAAATALNTAITTFQAAAASYLAQVGKVQ